MAFPNLIIRHLDQSIKALLILSFLIAFCAGFVHLMTFLYAFNNLTNEKSDLFACILTICVLDGFYIASMSGHVLTILNTL